MNDMPKITIEEIKKLRDAATKGKWEQSYEGGYAIRAENDDLVCDVYANAIANVKFITALPDIADLCIQQAEEIERLKAEKRACLKACLEHNGLPYCKNCGLTD